MKVNVFGDQSKVFLLCIWKEHRPIQGFSSLYLKGAPPPPHGRCFFVNWMDHMPFSSKPSTIAIKKPLLLCDLRETCFTKCPLFFWHMPSRLQPSNCLLWNVDILGLLFQCFVMENLNLWLCWYFSCKWEEITLCTINMSCIASSIICNRELHDRFRLWYLFGSLLDFFGGVQEHNTHNRVSNYWSLLVQRLCLCANDRKLKEFFQVISWTFKTI